MGPSSRSSVNRLIYLLHFFHLVVESSVFSVRYAQNIHRFVSLQTIQKLWPMPTHGCRASIRTLIGPRWARCMLGSDLMPRSITAVTDLGLLGLQSTRRSHRPAIETQSPEQGGGCRFVQPPKNCPCSFNSCLLASCFRTQPWT